MFICWWPEFPGGGTVAVSEVTAARVTTFTVPSLLTLMVSVNGTVSPSLSGAVSPTSIR